MSEKTATAIAHPNIAFIKYWGNRNNQLRLPANGSISMNLDGLVTRTSVTFSQDYLSDTLLLNHQPAQPEALHRVSAMLNQVRNRSGLRWFASIESENNFPTGAGVASSASAFAALSLAAATAAGLDLEMGELSRLARLGSGSACRSIPGGFVEWLPGASDADSHAYSLFPSNHWALVDCIAVIAAEHKTTGSTKGHASAGTSPLQAARVADAHRRLRLCREAIRVKDFGQFATVIELDSTLMHAVMMTSTPPLFYWEPASLALIKQVIGWRKAGIPVCATVDAGPNIHVITTAEYSARVTKMLLEFPGTNHVLVAAVGEGARLD